MATPTHITAVSYDAVLFDHDGVLVTLTSDTTHLTGAREAFEHVGVERPGPGHVEALSIGVTVRELTAACEQYGVDPAAFWRARDEVVSAAQRDEMRRGEKRPYDDVDALADLRVPLGVVSSNQRRTVEFSLDHFGLAERFETVQAREPTVESLRRKKPNTHYVDRALDALDASDALFIGDSESDVAAAAEAGIDAAFLRRSHTADAALSVTPDYEVEDLRAVVDLVEDR